MGSLFENDSNTWFITLDIANMSLCSQYVVSSLLSQNMMCICSYTVCVTNHAHLIWSPKRSPFFVTYSLKNWITTAWTLHHGQSTCPLNIIPYMTENATLFTNARLNMSHKTQRCFISRPTACLLSPRTYPDIISLFTKSKYSVNQQFFDLVMGFNSLLFFNMWKGSRY